MHNSSQNNFSNDDDFNNLSQTTAVSTVMRTPVTYNNNFDQQPMSNVAYTKKFPMDCTTLNGSPSTVVSYGCSFEMP